ncbi:uncharacterized protein LOC118494288 [Sander lucioperca]|uniref:uncharacterized protein LOC118494288 n=1 Tax=Sander lucioperca TaxID=283035 RepID=UPI001653E94F|nr:uncharacterized protein LOC118494288 [Sander lucioperca]
MSVDSDCVLLSSRDSRTSCVFPNEDEKDDVPGVGEESVLEMLSYSKFSNLETWLCMPSSLLLSRALDSTRTSSSSSSHASNHSSCSSSSSSSSSPASDSRHSTCSDPGHTDTPLRCPERDPTFLTSALGKEMPFLSASLLPVLSSTPMAATVAGDSAPRSGVSVRKRRRLAASPGGLRWNSAGSVQRDFWSPDLSPVSPRATAGEAAGGVAAWAGEHGALRKTLSVDERLLQPHRRLLSRLERGRKKLHNIQDGKGRVPQVAEQDGEGEDLEDKQVVEDLQETSDKGETPLTAEQDAEDSRTTVDEGESPLKAGCEGETPQKTGGEGESLQKAEGETPLKTSGEGKSPQKAGGEGKSPQEAVREGKTPLEATLDDWMTLEEQSSETLDDWMTLEELSSETLDDWMTLEELSLETLDDWTSAETLDGWTSAEVLGGCTYTGQLRSDKRLMQGMALGAMFSLSRLRPPRVPENTARKANRKKFRGSRQGGRLVQEQRTSS